MKPSDSLVSVGLPVRNGGDRIEKVVRSVLAQDHDRIELVISDNASTDDTEELCRELVAADNRIVYHRHPQNVGLLNNFVSAIRTATGTYFRWIGDDDWLAPNFVSCSLRAFAEDERRVLVTTQLDYIDPDGLVSSDLNYDGAQLASSDPIDRLAEMLRLLNQSYLLIDPLYALVRREPVAAIRRRNMLREDEVFATKLALAGPWGHVPQVLGSRSTKVERMTDVAKRLGVPGWQVHLATTLQCREILHWIGRTELTPEQQRRARAAVRQMYLHRQIRTYTHRGHKLMRMTAGAFGRGQGRVSASR